MFSNKSEFILGINQIILGINQIIFGQKLKFLIKLDKTTIPKTLL